MFHGGHDSAPGSGIRCAPTGGSTEFVAITKLVHNHTPKDDSPVRQTL